MSSVRMLFVIFSTFMGFASLSAQAQFSNFTPVNDEILQNPAPEDWLMWRRTLNSWGYSPLDEINKNNVSQLELVWSSELGDGGVQEGTPLVYDGILYMPSPKDLVQAMDAATGELLWEYKREVPEDLRDYIGASVTNRALAIFGDSIIYTTNDDYILALDVKTGEVNWETQIFDFHEQPVQQSSGVIIIDGKAISGRTCFPTGGPDSCVIMAHDALTGEELWRLNTIQRPGEGEDTWGGIPWEERWHVGAWMMPSYDPELDLIYMGTSVTAPAPKFLLAGSENTYLYHNSTLAISPDDGVVQWYYQHLVDQWDLDHPFERLLVDTQVMPNSEQVSWINPNIEHDKEYKVITGIPGKTGVVYTLDRETGEFLWARPTVRQTVVDSIDGATGVVTANPDMNFTEVGHTLDVCPSMGGGKNWQAGAYSPLNNTMYYSLQNTCASVTATLAREDLDEDILYGISSQEKLAPGEINVGTIQAISAETGELKWRFESAGTSLSLLTTGSGLVFGGDIEGYARALDQETGKVLWEVNLGSGVTGYPISFGVDGRQYIAISTGSSVTTSSQRNLLSEGSNPGIDNQLYIFALPD